MIQKLANFDDVTKENKKVMTKYFRHSYKWTW